ncbi:Flp family type IVb pilin [Neobacillus sp. YIM B06451]|uniref:Flp family type IVb pilin n=1 Tax=Neobacillus sp. YIM B06451 TaxID=3070994 RepID=UPI00292DF83E|nr:Flp family type IVb pilin [Neobacillus sp. YIM B06451]
MNLVTRLVKEEEGQAMTEYGLIIGLVAVVCIAAVATIGDEVARLLGKVADKLKATATT